MEKSSEKIIDCALLADFNLQNATTIIVINKCNLKRQLKHFIHK